MKNDILHYSAILAFILCGVGYNIYDLRRNEQRRVRIKTSIGTTVYQDYWVTGRYYYRYQCPTNLWGESNRLVVTTNCYY